MRFYGDVIARKGKKYWVGRIKRGTFYPDREIESLKELDSSGKKYVTLKEYSVILGLNLINKKLDDIRKKTGYTELWVMDQPPPKTSKTNDIKDTTWNRWYFRFLHSLCQSCVKTCKQSSRVDVVCPSYEKKQ